MPQPILSNDTGSLRLPTVGGSSTVSVVAVFWLLFACGLPLYQLREARRQAHQDLLRILASDKPDAGSVLAAFDRSNQNLAAAASGPCLILALTSLFLVNRMFKLKRRYDAPPPGPAAPAQRRSEID